MLLCLHCTVVQLYTVQLCSCTLYSCAVVHCTIVQLYTVQLCSCTLYNCAVVHCTVVQLYTVQLCSCRLYIWTILRIKLKRRGTWIFLKLKFNIKKRICNFSSLNLILSNSLSTVQPWTERAIRDLDYFYYNENSNLLK